MSTSQKFKAISVEWDFRMANLIGNPSPVKMRTSPKKVTARCESCGFTFVTEAGNGPGNFRHTVAGPNYECQCGNKGSIDIREFT